MNITREWLDQNGACADGIAWFVAQRKTNLVSVVKALMLEERFDWANWVITRTMTHKQKVQYAIFAAEQVIEVYEKRFPNDDRPRKAIEAAKKFIKTGNSDADDATNAAAYTANAAAYAAAYAATTNATNATNVPDAATYAAAYAAKAAAFAAKAAAFAVAADAARAAANAAYAAANAAHASLRQILINHGLKLLAQKGDK